MLKYRYILTSMLTKTEAQKDHRQDKGGVRMGAIPQEVLGVTTDYINKLKRQIPVEKVVLFGSYYFLGLRGILSLLLWRKNYGFVL